MKKIQLCQAEFIGNINYMESEVVEVHEDRARRLVKTGAAEYFVNPVTVTVNVSGDNVEFEPEPPQEIMATKRRRSKKGD